MSMGVVHIVNTEGAKIVSYFTILGTPYWSAEWKYYAGLQDQSRMSIRPLWKSRTENIEKKENGRKKWKYKKKSGTETLHVERSATQKSYYYFF